MKTSLVVKCLVTLAAAAACMFARTAAGGKHAATVIESAAGNFTSLEKPTVLVVSARTSTSTSVTTIAMTTTTWTTRSRSTDTSITETLTPTSVTTVTMTTTTWTTQSRTTDTSMTETLTPTSTTLTDASLTSVAQATHASAEESDEAGVSCSSLGCGGPFVKGRTCQCNHGCAEFGDCCADFRDRCGPSEAERHRHGQEPESPLPLPGCTRKVEGVCSAPRIMAHAGASAPLSCMCPPPLVPHSNESCNECLPAEEPQLMTFYMYRAQGDDDYPVENVNMADLAGVMWYLHREVVGSTPRKFGIKRIMRYSVTMKVTQDYFDEHPKQFAPFVAFDFGSAVGRQDIWNEYGYVVGCQLLQTDMYNYVPSSVAQLPCDPDRTPETCGSPTWYSLPGPCPELDYKEKLANPSCRAEWPGGACPSAVVTGEHDCTYFAAPAGEISLDELEGIADYEKFWLSTNSNGDILPNGNIEYDHRIDAGVGMHFWDKRHDQESCTRRMESVTKLFKAKYPELPEALPRPPCS